MTIQTTDKTDTAKERISQLEDIAKEVIQNTFQRDQEIENMKEMLKT